MSESKTFNYRILVSEEGEDVILEIHRVYYDNGRPVSYGEKGATIVGETEDELFRQIDQMISAANKPYLYFGDRFPEEYIIEKNKPPL